MSAPGWIWAGPVCSHRRRAVVDDSQFPIASGGIRTSETAPTVSERSDEVLAKVLRYGADRIATLREAGALG